jgi:hypothetical protein
LSCLIIAIGGGAFLGKGSFPGADIWLIVCLLRYLCCRILHMVNRFYQALLVPWKSHDDI